MRGFTVGSGTALILVAWASCVFADPSLSKPFLGGQSINLQRLQKSQRHERHPFLSGQVSSQIVLKSEDGKYDEFPEQWFEQPLDHFSDDPHTFRQRYWFSTRHYKPGGPVFVLDGGETSGEDRLPFLDTGILEILSKATSGLGIVLEHRYYGESIPVSNFSTDSLRWLNNDQAAADSANFMSKVKFEGIDDDLTAPGTPWIYYGGSYAGARSAHMRVLYPELVFGAIASSGVTHAQIQLWEYYDVIRRAAKPQCSEHIQLAVRTIDHVLLRMPHLRGHLKALFGLGQLEHDDDFAEVIASPLGAWQAKVWDPEVGSNEFDRFCAALASPFKSKGPSDLLTLPGHIELPLVVYNYGKYVRENIVSGCTDSSIEECFGTYDDAKFQDTSLNETWRAWTFQVCTEWGYFQTAPPSPDQPSVLSRLVTLESQSKVCKQAFPPGKYFKVPLLPNVTAVNVLGDFDITADRLAIIDGEVDPWRPATPHSEYAPNRPDTVARPFKLIPDGVHHYDEYGLKDMNAEPFEILNIHKEMISFVKAWLKEWDELHQ